MPPRSNRPGRSVGLVGILAAEKRVGGQIGGRHNLAIRSFDYLISGSDLTEYHQHSDGTFDEFRTDLDHFAFGVSFRAELEEWEQRLRESEVTFTPIAETPIGSVIVFRDPDNIQLEFWLPAAEVEQESPLSLRQAPFILVDNDVDVHLGALSLTAPSANRIL